MFFQIDPAWAPDASRIAFASRRHVVRRLLDACRRERHAAADHDEGERRSPHVVARRKSIAFTRSPGRIYVMNVDGSGAHRLTKSSPRRPIGRRRTATGSLHAAHAKRLYGSRKPFVRTGPGASRHELRTDDLRPGRGHRTRSGSRSRGSRRDDLRHLQRRPPGSRRGATPSPARTDLRARLVSPMGDDRLLARRRDRADRPERQHHAASRIRRTTTRPRPGTPSRRTRARRTREGRPRARGGGAARGGRRSRSVGRHDRGARSADQPDRPRRVARTTCDRASRAAVRPGLRGGRADRRQDRLDLRRLAGADDAGAIRLARADRGRARDRRAGGRRRGAAGLGIAGLAGWPPFAGAAGRRRDGARPRRDRLGRPRRGADREAARCRQSRRRRPPRGGLERARQVGADATIRLDEAGDLEAAFKEAFGGEGPSYVFDQLWGEPAAAASGPPPRATVVNLGQSAGATAELASAAVRFKSLSILGHTNFAVLPDELAEHYRRLVTHVAAGDIRFDVERVHFDSVTDAWRRQAEGAGTKLVVVPQPRDLAPASERPVALVRLERRHAVAHGDADLTLRCGLLLGLRKHARRSPAVRRRHRRRRRRSSPPARCAPSRW